MLISIGWRQLHLLPHSYQLCFIRCSMKFNSQICTTREQSERLIALGLKKETADICHYYSSSFAEDWTIVPLAAGEKARHIENLEIPAWSLHRLIEMLGCVIQTDGKYISLPDFGFHEGQSLYDNVINCIEWLIKKGDFNKEI